MASWIDHLLDHPWLSDGRAQVLAAVSLLLLAGEVARHQEREGSRVVSEPPAFPRSRLGLRVTAPWDPSSPILSWHPEAQVQTWMAPHDFLLACSATQDETWRVDKIVDRYRERLLLRGRPVRVLELDLGIEEGRVVVLGHEGRHRATAALRLGLPAVPVVLTWRIPLVGQAPSLAGYACLEGEGASLAEARIAASWVRQGRGVVRPQFAPSPGKRMPIVLRDRAGRPLGRD